MQGVSEDKSEGWEGRKAHTIECMRTAPMEVLLATCADKPDNLQSIRDDLTLNGEQVWDRFKCPKHSRGSTIGAWLRFS